MGIKTDYSTNDEDCNGSNPKLNFGLSSPLPGQGDQRVKGPAGKNSTPNPASPPDNI